MRVFALHGTVAPESKNNAFSAWPRLVGEERALRDSPHARESKVNEVKTYASFPHGVISSNPPLPPNPTEKIVHASTWCCRLGFSRGLWLAKLSSKGRVAVLTLA